MYATGVTIGNVLYANGSATVCQSTILAVSSVSAGGSLEVGGPDCQGGNTITGSLAISNDNNNVWVWGNKIKSYGTVKGGHGATDSIVGNIVGNLYVVNSGPVFVKDNHAKTGSLKCTNDNPLTGSGNTAGVVNTCPH